jgi:hypothetical protein
MPAPKGNEFWKLRSKHGRDKLFESPELMWEAACEYFKWCQDNPWSKQETTVKPNGIDVKTIPTERPFTMQGLCLYLDCNTKYFNNFKKQLSPDDEDFNYIITRIEEIVYQQKFEGAAVGAFNANIIARDLGLKEKQDIDLKDDRRTLTNEEREKRIEELKTKLNIKDE